MESSFALALLFLLSVRAQPYQDDCSLDPKVACRIQEDSCHKLGQATPAPSAPHSLTITQLTKTMPQNKKTYNLVVHMRWRPPYDGTAHLLKGFELSMVAQGSSDHKCFHFEVVPDKNYSINSDTTQFQFVTTNVFDYGRKYNVDLQSLPRSTSTQNFVTDVAHMPTHPEMSITRKALCQSCWIGGSCCDAEQMRHATANCSNPEYAHPEAFRWVSAFRKVYIHPSSQLIDVEFVAAPHHYCFEKYELRLMLHKTLQIVQHKTVHKSELYTEQYENITASYGRTMFTNLGWEPKVFDVAVVPVDRRIQNNFCLCPRSKHRDHRLRCECTQTTWTKIRYEPEPPVAEPNDCNKDPIPAWCALTTTTNLPPSEKWHPAVVLSLLILLCLLSILCALCVFIVVYRAYKRKEAKTIRFRFIPTQHPADFAPMRIAPIENGYMVPDKGSFKVLLVYSHDCLAHEQTVVALADYLAVRLNCDVQLDSWNSSAIASNKVDWAYSSLAHADKVIIIHSTGAFYRYQAKINERVLVELSDPHPFDDLFLLQLDFIANELHSHKNGLTKSDKYLSAYFSYTSDAHLLSQLVPQVRFSLPEHLDSLCGFISERDGDRETLATQQPLLDAVRTTAAWQKEHPDWFQSLHVRNSMEKVHLPLELIMNQAPPACSAALAVVREDIEQEEPLLEAKAGSTSTEDSGVVVEDEPTSRRMVEVT